MNNKKIVMVILQIHMRLATFTKFSGNYEENFKDGCRQFTFLKNVHSKHTENKYRLTAAKLIGETDRYLDCFEVEIQTCDQFFIIMYEIFGIEELKIQILCTILQK
ncbi:hypothetical protein EDEG_02091 [Edhazardia aedis USNM 41457]|uniref:Uncharacterized protein n=1 Tax=Edhazardia aedis (strain USNM 41457) TaxID=1003232 RepID=J9D7W0_EDHAE|nr:hypothetical protein EDEG_02091 [Edhazardia aedis USNM 41457]|eukprot:EJW03579.1 hypothetical protein EDEG_02091 [Edhazardia aedis USNM 41457]